MDEYFVLPYSDCLSFGIIRCNRDTDSIAIIDIISLYQVRDIVYDCDLTMCEKLQKIRDRWLQDRSVST